MPRENFHTLPSIHERDDRVWLMSGSKDTVVLPGVVRKLELFYKHFVAPTNVKVELVCWLLPCQSAPALICWLLG